MSITHVYPSEAGDDLLYLKQYNWLIEAEIRDSCNSSNRNRNIRNATELSLRDFMVMAIYHPEWLQAVYLDMVKHSSRFYEIETEATMQEDREIAQSIIDSISEGVGVQEIA